MYIISSCFMFQVYCTKSGKLLLCNKHFTFTKRITPAGYWAIKVTVFVKDD